MSEQLVKTMKENIIMGNMLMDTLEETINNPDEIEQIIDDADATIEFIKNIARKTFFQKLPTAMQTELTEVINFLAEAVREKEYIASNRLTVPENMIIDPERITVESVAKIFEIALCRYLTFAGILYTDVVKNHAEEFEKLDEDQKEAIQDVIANMANFEPLMERNRDYMKISFEEYASVHFVSYEDDLASAEEEALEENSNSYAKNVIGFGDFTIE